MPLKEVYSVVSLRISCKGQFDEGQTAGTMLVVMSSVVDLSGSISYQKKKWRVDISFYV
jgi:hypothetical protein